MNWMRKEIAYTVVIRIIFQTFSIWLFVKFWHYWTHDVWQRQRQQTYIVHVSYSIPSIHRVCAYCSFFILSDMRVKSKYLCLCLCVSMCVCNQRLANDLILLLIDSSTAKCVKLPFNTISHTPHTNTYSHREWWVFHFPFIGLHSLVLFRIRSTTTAHRRSSSYSPKISHTTYFPKTHYWFNQNVWQQPEFISQ